MILTSEGAGRLHSRFGVMPLLLRSRKEMERSWYASYCAGGRAMASLTVSGVPLAQGARVRLCLT